MPLFPEDVVDCRLVFCGFVALLWGCDRPELVLRRDDAGSCFGVLCSHSTALQRLCGFLAQVCLLRQPPAWLASVFFCRGMRRKALQQPLMALCC